MPVATCAAFWANSTTEKDTLKITGTNHLFGGCVHSNNDLVVNGGAHTFNRTARHAGPFTTNDNAHTLHAGTVQVTPEPYPFPFRFSEYAPGGCEAVKAAARGQYFTHSGNVQLRGASVAPGLHYVDGSAHVDLSDTSGPFTVVATGSVKLATSEAGATAYVDGLIAFANGSGPNTLTFASNGGAVTGAFYAPHGEVSFAGKSLRYTGQVQADVVSVSGSDSVFIARAPVSNVGC